MTTLATIQKVEKIVDLGADRVELAHVLGWTSIVGKGDFKAGDLCVFLEPDAVLPDKPEYEFMRQRKFKVGIMKSKRFNCVSQGLCLPTKGLNEALLVVGTDVQENLAITKYEKPIPQTLMGEMEGSFPTNILPKTDELRIQSFPAVLDELKDKQVAITVKLDGTSATFLKVDGVDKICSRNNSWKRMAGNVYWKMYDKYDIAGILNRNPDVAIQGEVVGPGINKNPLQLKDLELYVFNAWHIPTRRYFNHLDLKAFCSNNALQMVPVIYESTWKWDMQTIQEYAKGNYQNAGPREGIVVRPLVEEYSKALGGRLSVKIINNEYKDE